MGTGNIPDIGFQVGEKVSANLPLLWALVLLNYCLNSTDQSRASGVAANNNFLGGWGERYKLRGESFMFVKLSQQKRNAKCVVYHILKCIIPRIGR